MPKKKELSGGKVFLAIFTGGLSLPFVGLHTKSSKQQKRTKTIIPKTTKYTLYESSAKKLNIFGNINHLGTDLVESSDVSACCPKCAMYRRRIYSLSGKDKRFPKIPSDFDSTCCGINLHPYIFGISEPSFSAKDPIKYSNRPFVDDRTGKERKDYQAIMELKEEQHQKEIDRKIYEKLLSSLPNDCPKSFGAFRKMKKSNSKGYQDLKVKAIPYGIEL